MGRTAFSSMRDFATLAQRILDLLTHPELVRAFSEQSRAHVLRHYDAASLIERQIDAYREVALGLTSGRGSAPPEVRPEAP